MAEKKVSTIQTIKNLMYLCREDSKGIFLIVVLTFAYALLETLSLSMILPLLQSLISSVESENLVVTFVTKIAKLFEVEMDLWFILSMMSAMIVLKSIINLLNTYISNNIVWGFARKWSSSLYSKYLNSESMFFYKLKQGEVSHNILEAPGFTAIGLSKIVGMFVSSTVAFMLLTVLLITNFKVSLLVVSVLGLIFLMVKKKTKKFLSERGNEKLTLLQDINSKVIESLTGYDLIKSFSLLPEMSNKVTKLMTRLQHVRVSIITANALPQALGEVIVITMLMGLLFYIEKFEGLSIKEILPTIGLFVVISQKLYNRSAQVFSLFMFIQERSPYISLMSRLMSDEIKQEQDTGTKDITKIEEINLDNISVKYDESKVISNLSFNVASKKTTAIVGRSGSGKSTIIKTLLKLVPLSGGDIVIGNKSITDIKNQDLRDRIAYVSQDSFLFHDTILNNLKVVKPNASREEVIDAAKRAQIHEFIESLDNGYNTVIGDKGVTISGGQRQRLAIARALLKDCDLYIFDEATSALDIETERAVQCAIEEIYGEKTVIIIAHRLETIKNADVVINLNELRA